MKKFLLIFVSLLLGVVVGVGVWHGIAYKDELKIFADNTWSKIESVFKKADETPSEDPNDDTPTPETPHEHLWSEWTTTVVPTCTESGNQTRTCDCGATETQTISALGHDYVDGFCEFCGSSLLADYAGFYYIANGSVIELDSLGQYRYVSYMSAQWENGSCVLVHVHEQYNPLPEFRPLLLEEIEHGEYAAYDFEDFLNENVIFYFDAESGTLYDSADYFYPVEICFCGDVEQDWSYISLASCTFDGYEQFFCSCCGNPCRAELLPALGGEHEYVDGICSRCFYPEPPQLTLDGDILTIVNYCDKLSYELGFDFMYGPFGGLDNCSWDLSAIASSSLMDGYYACGSVVGIDVRACHYVDCYGGACAYVYSNDFFEYVMPHTFIDGICTRCGEMDSNHMIDCSHDYVDDICTLCGALDVSCLNGYYLHGNDEMLFQWLDGTYRCLDVGASWTISDDGCVSVQTSCDFNSLPFEDLIVQFEEEFDCYVARDLFGEIIFYIRNDSGEWSLWPYLYSNVDRVDEVKFSHSYSMGECEICWHNAIHHSMMTDEMFAHMTRANVESDLGTCTLLYNSSFDRFEYDFGDYKLCLGWLNDNYYFYVEGKCDNILLDDGLDISSAYGYFDGLDFESSTII